MRGIMIWDFSALTGKANRFYRRGAAGLALTLTFPWGRRHESLTCKADVVNSWYV